MSAPTVVSLSRLSIRDIPSAAPVIVVRDWDATPFKVTRLHAGPNGRINYEVYNRTCITGGTRIVRNLDGVRAFIRGLA